MTEKNEPFKLSLHAGDVSPSLVTGSTSIGNTVSAELAKLWSAGHPGGSSSFAEANDDHHK